MRQTSRFSGILSTHKSWRCAAWSLVLCSTTLSVRARAELNTTVPVETFAMPYEAHAKAILSRLSLPEKIGQMIQAEIINVEAAMSAGQHPLRDLNIGSVLSGGDSIIQPNTPESWRRELGRLQDEALASSARLPLLIGVDAVHGHGLVRGSTVFPHNIGLGASRDPELLRQIGAAVAAEVLTTGFNWTFAPAVTVARDARWGRTYESFGSSPELQQILVKPYILGLQETAVGQQTLVATAKHFLGDGGTTWGTGVPSATTAVPQIDRGDTRGDLEALLAVHAQGYKQAIAADVNTVMASYSSINGQKMHGNRQLLTDYLKKPIDQGGLGFQGFVISDWNAIDELETPGVSDPLHRYQAQLVQAVNAGVDMIMVFGQLTLADGSSDHEFRFTRVHQLLADAVEKGLISPARIDDAVGRILRIKIKSGLINTDGTVTAMTPVIAKDKFGGTAHRELARKAVRSSLVLLKNADHTLPITKQKYRTLCVAGAKADDFGVQAGAWTMGWQGTLGNGLKAPEARTVLDGLTTMATTRGITVEFAANGEFAGADCRTGDASLTLAVVGETPYAEFKGDSNALFLSAEDLDTLAKARSRHGPMAVVLISGRPLVITDQLPSWQSLVAAWLPGSQGEGVADVLFGDFDFRGRLPQTWPATMAQLPATDHDTGLFPFGFGLSY